MLRDGEEFEIASDGQRWAASWHPGPVPPEGRRHGATGICLTEAGGIVVISEDGMTWNFPGGRPEGEETWEQTLGREILEEACAVIEDARLLGFSRSRCVEGREQGLVLVRSVWLAQVRLLEWKPQFEVPFRRVVPLVDAITEVSPTERAIWLRVFADAKLQ